MMAIYRNIHTRRLALIESFGLSPSEVPEDGVTEDYVSLVGDHSERFPDSRLEMASDAPILTHVEWPNAQWQAKAKAAIEGDWKESTTDTPNL